jgi:chorismate-pyruvate lyase
VEVIGEGLSTSPNWRVRHRPPMLGEVLVANERATTDDVGRALREQRRRADQPIGEIMVSLGLITRIDLDAALAVQRSESGNVTVVLDGHPDA